MNAKKDEMIDLKSKQFLNIFLKEKIFPTKKINKVNSRFKYKNKSFVYHTHNTLERYKDCNLITTEKYPHTRCVECKKIVTPKKGTLIEIITMDNLEIGANPVWHVLCFPLWEIKR